MRCAALLLVFVLVGCALEDEPGPAPGTCEAGKVAACPCEDGSMGTQACKADGTGWLACDCEGATPPGGCSTDVECVGEARPICFGDECIAGTRVPGGGDCGFEGAICEEGFECLQAATDVQRCYRLE